MPEPSFFACIDESGDQGFSFEGDRQSSRWFVLSAVVGLTKAGPQLSATLINAKKSIRWPEKKHLHFKDVRGESRSLAIQQLLNGRNLFRTVVVMFHKPHLGSPEAFNEQNRLYFYATRLLLERVSWLCKTSSEARVRAHGDGSCKVIFSKMNEVSKTQLIVYLRRLKESDPSSDWSVFNPDHVLTLSPAKHAGLQIADVVANSFYCCDHPTQARREQNCAELLKPVLYRGRNGKYRGYGIKLFPVEAEKAITQGLICPWVTELFPE